MFSKAFVTFFSMICLFFTNDLNWKEYNLNDPRNDFLIERLYYNTHNNNFELPKLQPYKKALRGFLELKSKNVINGNKLVLIDFSLPSDQKRLWIIDLNANSILYNCLVTHGRGTGDLHAHSFSNELHSNKSSLGFYTTAETYIGKHGLSLKLNGLEKGLNHKARERGIVLHGADYVSESFISKHGILGRSLGCPAVPLELHEEIINTIKNGNCLFIYHTNLE